MFYYLPINIDDRRLHVFKLTDVQAVLPVPEFSFIVKVRDNVSLLSINSDLPQLISSEGLNGNISLIDHRFRVEKATDEIQGLPTYRIIIERGRASGDVDNHCLLKARGFMGAEEEEQHAVVKIDHTQALDRTAKALVEPCFIMVVSYRSETDDKVYEDAVKVYLYTEDNQLASAALDFGSEASQIRFGGNDSNSTVIDTLLSFGSDGTSSKVDRGVEYWQGKPGDQLYKSVFFIHMNPGPTKYAEKPLVGVKDAFVQPLLSNTTPREEYDSLELLPNLKLIEIGLDRVIFSGRRIQFDTDTEIDIGNSPSLSSQPLRESILRIILSNFLHCILKDLGGNNRREVLLRMVLMVPNVYYQSKIHTLMRDLYKDFEAIKAKSLYPACTGFEVQVVSESDAAFLGVKHNRRDVKNARNGHFLIIDAGKGTTDFSILQQQADFSQFSSLYRDGIPASGNVLTYVFHEALYGFFKKNGIELNEMLRRASNSELLGYMSYLEQLKKNYTKARGSFATPQRNNIRDLSNLNTYLNEESSKHHRIPGCDEFVDRKIQLLCDSLQKSIGYYMKTQKYQFLQVLLTGRGFLFEPFKAAVIRMLKTNNWISGEEAVIRVNGDEAKTVCLSGALAIEKECSVNYNSGLIGSPIVEQTLDYGNVFQRFFSKVSGFFSRNKEINLDFFYQGSSHVAAQNITITIGGRQYEKTSSNREEKSLVYTGDGFMIQKENSSERVDEHNFIFSDETVGNLVLDSLFPFYPGSIRDEIEMPEVETEEARRSHPVRKEPAAEDSLPQVEEPQKVRKSPTVSSKQDGGVNA